MCSSVDNIIRPSDLTLQIGTDGISSLSFIPKASKRILVAATSNGRVRIFDCSENTPKTLYQKRWHLNIRCLLLDPFSPNRCITASKQCCIKVHDIETQQRTMHCKKMEDSSPYSALISIADHRWVTGDDNGFVKFWDDRQPGGHCFTITPKPEEGDEEANLTSINDFAVGNDPQGTLLAAVDNGVLASYNLRRRRLELTSEPLGYSARALVTVKNGKKVLLGTDEGVIHTYNWGEFGSVCDRFPVRTSRTRVLDQLSSAKAFGDAGLPAVEKIVSASEDVVVIATDDGAISPMCILPNRMLNCLGWHNNADDFEGGDCMTLAVSPDHEIIASGVPLAPTIKFWPIDHLEEESREEMELLSLPKKQRLATGTLRSTKSAKSKSTSRVMDLARSDFMSGLFSLPDDDDEETSDD